MVSINNRDPRPIYEQIADGFKKLIISGVLQPDERLPSVRELSQQLAINPNTIQRAYRELERGGYSYSIPGKGNFAGAGREVDDGKKRELLDALEQTLRELRYLGVSDAELLSFFENGGEEK